MSNSKTKIDSLSSDYSSPVALVTASNLRKDTLCLPQVLCPTDSINDGTQGGNDKKKKRGRPPISLRQTQFMTLKLAQNGLITHRQYLSLPFMRENGMTKLGQLTLVGRDGVRWQVKLRGERNGRLWLGTGWNKFSTANGLKTGEYFTFEFVSENGIGMLRLVNAESTSDRMQIGESSKAMEKEFSSSETCNINQTNKEKNNKDEGVSNTESINDGKQGDNDKKKKQGRGPNSLIQKQFMTLRLAHDSLIIGRQYLSLPFMRENGMTKLGLVTLIGREGVRWQVSLREERNGRSLCLGSGWKDFARANGLKTGEYFTFEFVSENGIKMLRLVNTESPSDLRQIESLQKPRRKSSFPPNLAV